MTPDDVAAIRATYDGPAHITAVHALCDALEASWAARDARYTGQELKLERINRKNAEKRAERAEAEASVTTEALRHLGARADVMAAALARVRALCDGPLSGKTADWLADEIRAAIEGGKQ